MGDIQQATIRDLLTPAQCKRVVKIVNSIPSTTARVAALKKYFREIEVSINQKAVSKFGNTGINPDWLAYVVENAAMEQTRGAQPQN